MGVSAACVRVMLRTMQRAGSRSKSATGGTQVTTCVARRNASRPAALRGGAVRLRERAARARNALQPLPVVGAPSEGVHASAAQRRRLAVVAARARDVPGAATRQPQRLSAATARAHQPCCLATCANASVVYPMPKLKRRRSAGTPSAEDSRTLAVSRPRSGRAGALRGACSACI